MRVLLAYCYERVKGDYGACRRLIFEIDESGVSDRARNITRIWRGAIESNERAYTAAHETLAPLLARRPPDLHWYLFYSSRVVAANLYLSESNRDAARMVVAEVEKFFAGPYFKLIQLQMKVLKRLLRNEKQVARVRVSKGLGNNGLPNPSLTGNASQVVSRRPDEWLKAGLIGRQSLVRNLT